MTLHRGWHVGAAALKVSLRVQSKSLFTQISSQFYSFTLKKIFDNVKRGHKYVLCITTLV